MEEAGIDLLALAPSANMFYLSHFTDEPGERILMLLVPKADDPVFVVPELYADQVKENSTIDDLRIWGDSDDPHDLLKQTLNELKIRKAEIAVDDPMWASFLLTLEDSAPESNFVLASNVMTSLRMVKTSEEIDKMAEAGTIADNAFEKVSELALEGMTELEIARELENEMIQNGADKISFEALIASGPNSALPHHRAGKRKVGQGDSVIFDFGCKIDGYCSDTSRTVFCGEPTTEQKEVHQIVKEAQERAFQAVKPGIEAQEIDSRAREVIEQAGYGSKFPHRTGHGIGLDVHEEPYIVSGNSIKLEPGMTFSIEPGIYLQGNFGVRIEDIVVVTKEGGKRLNKSTRELTPLGFKYQVQQSNFP